MNKYLITDRDTNFVYFSHLLPQRHKVFFEDITGVLKRHGIGFALLPDTKDIWCRDYMPIQISNNRFVQFRYDPGYLQSKKWKKTISDTGAICKKIGIKTIKSGIRIDGGNVVKSRHSATLTARIFPENPGYEPRKLLKELKRLLEVDRIILLPYEGDLFGHADGMVRFVTDDFVIINDYSKEDAKNYYNLITALNNAGLSWQSIPCNPYENDDQYDATGLYINYLQVGKLIILPEYGIKEDAEARKAFKKIFSGFEIESVRSNEIAKEGGVLNCVTWGIKWRKII